MELIPSSVLVNPNSLYALTSTINALTSLGLGCLILFNNPKSKLNVLWWLMSMAIAGWASSLAVTFIMGNTNYEVALLSSRLANTIAIFIPLFYLHFIIIFLNQNQRIVLRALYFLSISISCIGFTPLFIDRLQFGSNQLNYAHAGPLYWCYFLLYLLEPLFAISLLWKAKQNSTGVRRAHITHVMTAGVVGFTFGATMFPLCFDVPLQPIGGHFVWLYCLFVTWAVFKYQLFDIRIVIRKSLVYSMLVSFLTVGYFGVVYGIERLFQITLGYQAPWLSLAAFSLMAFLFQPLKIGIQRVVDWIIFRAPQEELARRLERFEEEAHAAEKQKAIATLAAGMAHEIKNPLTALKTYAEFIPLKGHDPAFRQKLHDVLAHETRRIQDIVQDLLEFSKPKEPHFKTIDPKELIDSTIQLLSSELDKKKVIYFTSYAHNGATIQADPDQIRQVLINLIQNAADAMPNGGKLGVTSEVRNGYLELRVSDTGIGIPKELLPQIFEPFVTTKPKGTGLGLSMVRSLIQAHHGSIHAESPGVGSNFIIRLPT